MSVDQESFVFLLMERLNDPKLTVRVHAGLQLEGLGIEAKPALPALLQLQQSDDVHNRRLAAVVLGSLGSDLAEAVPPLVNALQDEDQTVRRLAAENLEKITSARGNRKAA